MHLFKTLRPLTLIAATIALFACSNPFVLAKLTPETTAQQGLGERVAILRCSSCHAVSRTDTSTHLDATPLRDLSQSYPLETLRETLPQGLIVDHPNMPVFRLKSREVEALLEYLEDIQSRQIARLGRQLN